MNEHDKGQVAAGAAEIYEQFFVPALFAEWPGPTLQAAGLQPGDSVLDVACGTGIVARKAAEITSPGCVTGLDINPGMLAVAAKKAPDITWKTGPAESLPFEDNSFDRVVSQFALMFFENPIKALAEMKRVVRPGGAIAVTVWDTLDATPGYAVVAQILEDLFGPEVASSIHAPYSLGNKAKLTALFTQAGIENPAIHTLTGVARFNSIEEWIYTDIKGWTLADVIDEEGYQRLRQYAPAQLAQFVQPNGSVAFDAPAHIVVANGT